MEVVVEGALCLDPGLDCQVRTCVPFTHSGQDSQVRTCGPFTHPGLDLWTQVRSGPAPGVGPFTNLGLEDLGQFRLIHTSRGAGGEGAPEPNSHVPEVH